MLCICSSKWAHVSVVKCAHAQGEHKCKMGVQGNLGMHLCGSQSMGLEECVHMGKGSCQGSARTAHSRVRRVSECGHEQQIKVGQACTWVQGRGGARIGFGCRERKQRGNPWISGLEFPPPIAHSCPCTHSGPTAQGKHKENNFAPAKTSGRWRL